jgi:hypothetical protein
MPAEKLHLSVYSPPFGGLYHYSSDDRDLSNCKDYAEFFEHYTFVVRELKRLTMPGRMTAVHCMDVPASNTGKGDSIIDFPGDIIKLYEKLGFDMLPRIAIWKEPLSVRLRTRSKALAHRTICEDSTLTNVAASDYLSPFRKHGANPVPVAHPVGLTEYYGEREVPSDLMRYRGYEGKQTENRYSQWVWRHYASSMWDDIRLGEVLRYDEAKDEDDERHQHPLQLDVIYRAVTMWSNPGETVLTPFMGVGSEVYGAVKLGRRGIGCELKPSYYRQAVKNLRNIDDTPHNNQLDLLAMADDDADFS